jgi:hypothetical protein
VADCKGVASSRADSISVDLGNPRSLVTSNKLDQ